MESEYISTSNAHIEQLEVKENSGMKHLQEMSASVPKDLIGAYFGSEEVCGFVRNLTSQQAIIHKGSSATYTMSVKA